MNLKKYSQVIYFNEETTLQIRDIQKEVSNITGSKACLELWEPHITIGDAPELDEITFSSYEKKIIELIQVLKPFNIIIKDFGFMDNWVGGKLPGNTPYVIYLNIIITDQLNNLAQILKDNITPDYPIWYTQKRPYHPHLTIAFKDLDLDGYNKAKKILSQKTIIIQAIVDHIAISSENNNKNWKQVKKFNFSN